MTGNMPIAEQKQLRRALIIACLAAFAAFLAYLPALQNDFVNWDDDEYVYNNPEIQQAGLRLLSWAFFRFHMANWHPVTWLSHALDFRLWGLNPLGHHLTNNLLHAANSFLVVLLAVKLLVVIRRRSAPGSIPGFLSDSGILTASAATGLLFALHPLHVESVAWISERKDLLCGFFFLLGMLLYLPHGAGQEPPARPSSHPLFDRRYFLVLGCFVAALLSKPMAVTFPLVLLLLDWYPLDRFRAAGAARIALEKAPLFLLSISSAVITVLAQRSGSAIASFAFAPPGTRVLVAAHGFSAYLLKLLVPVNLAPLYPYPRHVNPWSISSLLPVLVVLVVGCLCIIRWNWRKPWSAFWGYYAITLLPVIGLVQIGFQSMADRYAYLPSLAPLLAISLFATRAWYDISTLYRSLQNWVRLAALAAAAGVLLVLSWLTVAQIGIWKDSLTLWNYETAEIPDQNPVAYYHRGMAWTSAKNFEAAVRDYTIAIAQDPDYYEAYNNRGVLYDGLDKIEPAISDFSRSLALHPHYMVYYNRGASYARIGRYREAVEDFTQSLSLKSDNAGAYVNRAFAYNKLGDQHLARLDFEKGCALGNKIGCTMLERLGKPALEKEQ